MTIASRSTVRREVEFIAGGRVYSRNWCQVAFFAPVEMNVVSVGLLWSDEDDGDEPGIGAPLVKLDVRAAMEFRGQPRRSVRRRCGKTSLLRMNYSQRSATTGDLLCTSECSPEWKVRFRRAVGRHPYVAQSVEWEDMESPELYVKQETVGTTFNSECQPDEPGNRICTFGPKIGQYG